MQQLLRGAPLSTSASIQLTIRTPRGVDDLARVHALYRAHAGTFLPVPDVDVLYEAMQDKQLFTCWHADGRLVGVGGTFWVGRCRHPGSIPISVYELAGLVVHPEVRGLRPHGVQDLLVAVRSTALALQQETKTCVVSSVATANMSSRKSMLRCGLTEIAEAKVPQWLRDVRRTWLAGTRPDVVDYIVPPVALRRHRGILNGTLSGSVCSRPDDPAAPTYRIRMGVEPLLDDISESEEALPSWSAVVPPQRLLGSEPPFVPWPR